MEETLLSLQQYKMVKEKDETIRQVQQQKLAQYEPDFKQFKSFSEAHGLPLTFETLELYLHQLITQQQVRLSTFNRRLAGVKYWLVHEHGFQLTSVHEASVKLLRSLYDQEAYMRLKPMRGQRAEKQSDVRKL